MSGPSATYTKHRNHMFRFFYVANDRQLFFFISIIFIGWRRKSGLDGRMRIEFVHHKGESNGNSWMGAQIKAELKNNTMPNNCHNECTYSAYTLFLFQLVDSAATAAISRPSDLVATIATILFYLHELSSTNRNVCFSQPEMHCGLNWVWWVAMAAKMGHSLPILHSFLILSCW